MVLNRFRTYVDKFNYLVATVTGIPSNLTQNFVLQEKQLMLSGRMASVQIRSKKTLSKLSDAEFRVFSQWGEDGIIDWLIENLPIENTNFVEFGVENFSEANCRFLLENRNWQGLVMDGSLAHMQYVAQQTYYWKYDLVAHNAFITAENINQLLKEQGFDGDIGLLSIDIDGNDYWVLKSIENCNPAILCLEYNPILGDLHEITVPYKPDFYRFDAHYSGLYFGASLPAMTTLAKSRGYTFVGTCSNGINAFYIKDDLAHHITEKLDEIVSWPSRHRDSRDKNGQLSFTRNIARSALFENEPVVNVKTGETVLVKELGNLYSDSWLNRM